MDKTEELIIDLQTQVLKLKTENLRLEFELKMERALSKAAQEFSESIISG